MHITSRLVLAILIYILFSFGCTYAEVTTPSILRAITVTANSLDVAQGSQRQFTATGTYEDGSTQDITNSVYWSSSDNTKATIDDLGLATALKAGVINITASSQGIVSAPLKLTLLSSPVVYEILRSGTINELVPFSIKNFTNSFSDESGDRLAKVKVTALPTHGKLTMGGEDVTLNDEIPIINLNSLAYNPDLNYVGDDYFWWVGMDQCLYSMDEAPVSIKINTEYPVITTISKSGKTNTVLKFTANDFINNFKDAPDRRLVEIKIIELPNYGKLKTNGDIVVINQEIPTEYLDHLIYVPEKSESFDDSFSWEGMDNLSLYSTNKAPVSIKISEPYCGIICRWLITTGVSVIGIVITTSGLVVAIYGCYKSHSCCFKSKKDRNRYGIINDNDDE